MWNNILSIGKTLREGLQVGAKAVTNELKYGAKVATNETKWGLKELERKRHETFGTAGPNSWEQKANDTVQYALDNSVIGIAEKGAQILGGNVAETVGLPRGVGEFVGGALAPGLAGSPTPPLKGLSRAQRASTGIQIKDNLKGVADALTTPPPPPMGGGLKPALAGATSGSGRNFVSINPGAKPNLSPQVMEAASTLPTPTNWQGRARTLYGNQDHKALADLFRRGQGGKLSKKNTFITADDLALNKGGVLDQQLERADRMSKLRTKWSEQGKEVRGDRQRELYDAATLNPNHKDIEMYTSDAARKYITKFTNVLSKDQWHHVFGNKEAGEFILSIAHSDPLVAANLFKKMEALGLNSSGVSKNIAILKEAKHTSWHNYMKEMGMEPQSPGKALSVKGSTAPGDFADLSQELGRAITSGKGDINDAFKLLELYSGYNKWMMQQITTKKFGGKIINELPEGVGKAIQIGGYQKRPPKSKYQPLPEL